MARRTIDLINRTFQLRTCDIEIDGKAPRPCLEYHIKRCLGPCVKGLCTPEEYQEAVRDVRMLLEGRNTELASKLEARMLHASEGMRYELAAKYRDLRKTVIKLSEQQKMATTSESDIDIFGYYREGKRLACNSSPCATATSWAARILLGRFAGRLTSIRLISERGAGAVLQRRRLAGSRAGCACHAA
jgi:excinuclease ABC subunit C